MKRLNNRVCVVTCYKQPEYVRAAVLRNAVKMTGSETIIVKNQSKSVFRYIEVMLKLLVVRLKLNPDTYLVTFRGYEILPFVQLIGFRKRIIFDEFINLSEWLFYEHQKMDPGSAIAKIINAAYSKLLNRCNYILADTKSHAEFSARLSKVSLKKYAFIPVGTDESIFKPSNQRHKKKDEFNILFYGSMLPLHGLKFILESAETLGSNSRIKFMIIGGEKNTEDEIKASVARGANIRHLHWVPFEKLGEYVDESDLCLGGPFGDTFQSNMVITGKTYQFIAAGKPTIVGQIEGIGKFQDKLNVILVKQGSAEEITNAIKWSYKNMDKLETIGINARKLYETNYSNKAIAESISRMFVN